jgi:hypothetical protein
MMKSSRQPFLAMLTLFATILIGIPAQAQDSDAIAATAETLFEAMRQADQDGVRSVFAEEAVLERVSAEGIMQRNRIDDFAGAVSEWAPGQVNEQVFGVVIQQFEQLATMWAPFTLKLDGELKACGVNQITLALLEGDWKIIHLVDRHYNGDCVAFIEMINQG